MHLIIIFLIKTGDFKTSLKITGQDPTKYTEIKTEDKHELNIHFGEGYDSRAKQAIGLTISGINEKKETTNIEKGGMTSPYRNLFEEP